MECQSCDLLTKQKNTLVQQHRTQQLWLNRIQSELMNQQSSHEQQKLRYQENNAQILKSNLRLQAQLDAATQSLEQLRLANERLKDRLAITERSFDRCEAELSFIRREYEWWKQHHTCSSLSSSSSSSSSSSDLIDVEMEEKEIRESEQPDQIQPLPRRSTTDLRRGKSHSHVRLIKPTAQRVSDVKQLLQREPSSSESESSSPLRRALDLHKNKENHDPADEPVLQPIACQPVSLQDDPTSLAFPIAEHLGRSTNRRASTSLISYREPKLNTKIRRGAAPGYKEV